MTLTLAFWILMLLWLALGVYQNRAQGALVIGGSAMLFLILLVLGWGVFGAPIQG